MGELRSGRRGWLKAAAWSGLGLAALGGTYAALRARDAAAWEDAVAALRAPPGPNEPPLIGLVRHGILAANSHNTQPWHFRLGTDGIAVEPDFARRTPSVDPDDHHLHASLGCAFENMVQAAPAYGLRAEPMLAAGSPAMLRLGPGPTERGALFQAIPRRRSTRAAFDGAALPAADLALLERAGQGDGVAVVLLTDAPRRARIAEMVVDGNAAQMRDAAFVAELRDWIRFSHAEALASRDGLFAAASGNPVLPGPLGRTLFPLVFTVAAETAKYVEHMRSSAGVAIFVADRNDPLGWLQAGRCAQRFCLQATALGIRTAWINQPVEVPALRGELAAWLGVAPLRPNLILRFGRGPELPPSLRRVPQAVIAGAAGGMPAG